MFDMIDFKKINLNVGERSILENFDLLLPEKQLILICGPTGSGKSSFLRMMNGLIPYLYRGDVRGQIFLNDHPLIPNRPRNLSQLIGYVPQDPASSFVTDTVIDELAFALEHSNVETKEIERRIAETSKQLSLDSLLERNLSELSAGQAQRVAIGAAIATQPKLLLLDEPTSALDSASAHQMLELFKDLSHERTVIITEHRIERVSEFVDLVILIDEDISVGTPESVFSKSKLAPPIIQLARISGWEEYPKSISDAHRLGSDLRERIKDFPRPTFHNISPEISLSLPRTRFSYAKSEQEVLHLENLTFRVGEIAAVMGHNGSGKSTLLKLIAGLLPHPHGPINLKSIGMVPANASDLLFSSTAKEECDINDRDHNLAKDTTWNLIKHIIPEIDPNAHPRDLSEGQKLALAISIIFATNPKILLLDEPTRGLDYDAKHQLIALLRSLALQGTTIIFSTHDVELVADIADRVILLNEGRVIEDGNVESIFSTTAELDTQIHSALAPSHMFTLNDVVTTVRGNAIR